MTDNNRRRLSRYGSSTSTSTSTTTPISSNPRRIPDRRSSMSHLQQHQLPHQLSPHQQKSSPAVKTTPPPQQSQRPSSQQQRSRTPASRSGRSGSYPPPEQRRMSSTTKSISKSSKNNNSNNYPPLQHMGQVHTTATPTYQQQREMQMRQHHQQQQQLQHGYHHHHQDSLPHNHSNSRSIHSHHSRSSSGGGGNGSNSAHNHNHNHNHNRAMSDSGSVHSVPTVSTAAHSNGSHNSGGGHDNSQRSQRSTASDPHAQGRGRGRGRSTSRQQQQQQQQQQPRSAPRSRSQGSGSGGGGGGGTFDLAIHEEHRDPFAETTSSRSNNHHLQQQQQYHNNNMHTPPIQSHRSSSPLSFIHNNSGSNLMIHPTPFKQHQSQHQRYNSSNTSMSIASTPTSNITPNNNNNNNNNNNSSSFRKINIIPAVVSTNKHVIKSTKKVIEELKKSADGSYPGNKRVIALTNACAEFDHLDDSRHNLELQQGAATSLCKVLAVVLNTADDQDCIDDTDDENENNNISDTNDCHNTHVSALTNEDVNHIDDALRMIATALEMVFRGQGTYVHPAYDKCGGTTKYESSNIGGRPSGLLPCLLRLLDRAEGVHYGTRMKRHNADVSLLNTTKVLLYLSRVPELRQHLARQPSLLDALCRVGNNLNISDNSNTLNGEEARVTRVRIIANLVNEEENKPLLLVHVVGKGENETGLLDALLRIAHMDPNERSREYASVALMDLASSPQNQITMTKNERLLATLVKMVLVEGGAAVNGAVGTPIRVSAITALQNLAFTKENRIRLVLFKNGIVLEALLKVLNGSGISSSSTNNNDPTKVVVGSNDNKSRRRAAGALTNLACDETAEIMGRHSKLLQTLAIVSTKDPSPEVQTRSAMALTKLAASLTIRMDYTDNDNDNDVQKQQENNQDTTTVPSHHHHRDGSSSTYSSASSRSSSVSVPSALKQQQQQQGNDNTTATNGGTTGCTSSLYSTLLDALIVASLSPVSNSVSAVLRVKARDPENRFIMAHHPGILDTLADMCHNNNGSSSNNTNNDHNVTDAIKDRDNATRALMHLTNESMNRTTMCTSTVLDALVKGASITDAEIDMNTSPHTTATNNNTNNNNENSTTRQALEDVRDSAVRALERLATEFPNRNKMAHHEGLLVAIAQATERESKLEQAQDCQHSIAGTCSASISNASNASASVRSGSGSGSSSVRSNNNINHGVVSTPTTPSSTTHHHKQQQQHHAYLAKPLLMSLLVAM